MKASDLMIGDWINPEKPMQVREVGEDWLNGTRDHYELKRVDGDIHPIPLSDDWLGNLGFIKFKHGRLVWWTLLSQNDARLRIECIDDIYVCTQVKRQIKYVHELQQLARAFTGEALTTKAQ